MPAGQYKAKLMEFYLSMSAVVWIEKMIYTGECSSFRNPLHHASVNFCNPLIIRQRFPSETNAVSG